MSGSVAGNSMGDFSEMDGMAPDAKISFFDIGERVVICILVLNSLPLSFTMPCPHPNNLFYTLGMTGKDYLKIPELNKIFDTAYKAGARVHTNSWGNLGGIYGQLSMDVDRYLHQHQDFFVLFAGGNEGYSGLRSVIAPGNAKNCLTVGATQLRTVAQDEELDDPVCPNIR